MVVWSFSESDRHSGGENHQDKGKPSTRIAATIMLRVRSIRLEPRPTLLARGSLSGDFVFLFLRLSPAPPPGAGRERGRGWSLAGYGEKYSSS